MSQPLYAILSAGSGTRLFPMSNKNVPKQFLKLENKYSLLQNTVLRMSQHKEIVITTLHKYNKVLCEQLNELNLTCKFIIVYVPESYNTAYSICALSLLFKNRKIIAVPSDKIFNQDEFSKLMESANKILDENLDKILFFGIKPTYAATGFGYLECRNNKLIKFVEKPTLEKANEYLKDGNHYWNGGMLGFVTNVLAEKYLTYRPDILEVCKSAVEKLIVMYDKNLAGYDLGNPDENDKIEDISIDYAINEKLKENEMSLIIFSGKWSDVGSWNSVYDILEKNSDGINKNANYKNYNSSKCLVMTKKPVYLNGVSNLVLIETDECFLVSHLDKSQDIKKLLLQ
jgi:mannose-1-phosphate guanylyltransferase/mannose-6-phosphate isomerase